MASVLSQMGRLTRADGSALAAYCVAWSRWVKAEAEVKRYGTVVLSPEKKYPMKSPYLCVADQAMDRCSRGLSRSARAPFRQARLRSSCRASRDRRDLATAPPR